jgi:hypothetical protein
LIVFFKLGGGLRKQLLLLPQHLPALAHFEFILIFDLGLSVLEELELGEFLLGLSEGAVGVVEVLREFGVPVLLFVEEHDEVLLGLDLLAELFGEHLDLGLLALDLALEVGGHLCELDLLDVMRSAVGGGRIRDDLLEHLPHQIVRLIRHTNDYIIMISS